MTYIDPVQTNYFINGSQIVTNLKNNATLSFDPSQRVTTIHIEKVIGQFCSEWSNMYIFLAFAILALYLVDAVLWRLSRKYPEKIAIAWFLKIEESLKENLIFVLIFAIIFVWWYSP